MSTIQSCLWLVGKGLQVAPRLLVDDAVEVVGSGRAEDAEDVVELVKVVLAREYWPEQSNVNSIYFLTSLDLLCPLNNKKQNKKKQPKFQHIFNIPKEHKYVLPNFYNHCAE